MSALVAAGAVEIALGALLGFPYSLVVDRSDRGDAVLSRLGVRHPPRLRQLHLDLIIMGALLMVAGTALPGLPAPAAWAIGVGGWTNALLFWPLMVSEAVQRQTWFRAATAASFLAVAGGWVAAAVHALTLL